jgi:hypothetical protein
MITSKAAFLMGFQDGQRDKTYYSAHQVLHRFPDWPDENVATYLNGLDDGIKGDDYRIAPILTPDLEQEVELERRQESCRSCPACAGRPLVYHSFLG